MNEVETPSSLHGSSGNRVTCSHLNPIKINKISEDEYEIECMEKYRYKYSDSDECYYDIDNECYQYCHDCRCLYEELDVKLPPKFSPNTSGNCSHLNPIKIKTISENENLIECMENFKYDYSPSDECYYDVDEESYQYCRDCRCLYEESDDDFDEEPPTKTASNTLVRDHTSPSNEPVKIIEEEKEVELPSISKNEIMLGMDYFDSGEVYVEEEVNTNQNSSDIDIENLMEDMLVELEDSRKPLELDDVYRKCPNGYDPLPIKTTVKFDITTIQRLLPQINFLENVKDRTSHPHPKGQWQRDFCETVGYAYLCKTFKKFNLIKIGDNPERSIRKDIFGHSLNYIERNHADVLRQQKYRIEMERLLQNSDHSKLYTICHCGDLKTAFCKHCPKNNIITMSVDSGYYSKISDNTNARLRSGLIKAHLEITGIFGKDDSDYILPTIDGEAIVKKQGENIIMGVKGNLEGAYSHQRTRVGQAYINTEQGKTTTLYPYRDGFIKMTPIVVIEWDENYIYGAYIKTFVVGDNKSDNNDYNSLMTEYKRKTNVKLDEQQPTIKVENVLSYSHLFHPNLNNCDNPIRYCGEKQDYYNHGGKILIATKFKGPNDVLVKWELVQVEAEVPVTIINKIMKSIVGNITANQMRGIINLLVSDHGYVVEQALLITILIAEAYSKIMITVNKFIASDVVQYANTGTKKEEQQALEDQLDDKIKYDRAIKHVLEFPKTIKNKVEDTLDTLSRANAALTREGPNQIDMFYDWVVDKFNECGSGVYLLVGALAGKISSFRIRVRSNAAGINSVMVGAMMLIMCMTIVTPLGAFGDNIIDEPKTALQSIAESVIAFVNILFYINMALIYDREGIKGICRLYINYITTYLATKLIILFQSYILVVLIAYLFIKKDTTIYQKISIIFSVYFSLNIQGVSTMRVNGIEIPEVYTGSCSPNDVAEMLSKMITSGLMSTKDKPNANAQIVSDKTTEELLTCDCKTPNMMKQKSPSFGGNYLIKAQPYVLHSCNRNNIESTYRQFSSQTTLNEDSLDHFANYFKQNMLPVLVDSMILSEKRISFNYWIDRYSGNKKVAYEQAYDEYLGMTYWKRGDSFTKRTTKMKNFNKIDEKVYVDYSAEEPKIKCRNITEQDNIIKVITGPIIDFVSSCCKTAFEGYGSGLSYQQRCEKFERWIKIIPDYKVVCIDGSAFDSCQDVRIMEITDVPVYMKAISIRQLEIGSYCILDDVHEALSTNYQVVTGKNFTYEIDGTQPSGKMNTSQGNTIRQLSYFKFICHKARMVEGEDYFVEVCGDDTFSIMKSDCIDDFKASAYRWVYAPTLDAKNHGLGQVAKIIEVFDSLFDAEYLSCNFLINNEGNIKMIQKPNRLLQLNPYTLSNNKNNINAEKLLNQSLSKGDGIAMLTWCGDIEFLTHYALMLIRLGGTAKEAYEKHHQYSVRVDKRKGSFNDAFLTLLKRRWNITEIEVKDLINKMIMNTDLYTTLQTTIIDKMWPTQPENLRKTMSFLDKTRKIPQILINKKRGRDYKAHRGMWEEDYCNELWDYGSRGLKCE